MPKEIDLTVNPHIGLLVQGALTALLNADHSQDTDSYVMLMEVSRMMAERATRFGMVPNRAVYVTRQETLEAFGAGTGPAIVLYGYVKGGNEAYVFQPAPPWLSAMIE